VSASLDGPAVRTFLRIADRWCLTPDEQCLLLGVGPEVLGVWRQHPPEHIGRDQIERISHIVAIYRALGVLIPDALFRDRWIRQPNQNALFGGCAPIGLLLAGDLRLVREYLDGACEG
jgi:hypothetical protein